MLYNIPGIFTSVIDKSYLQPLTVEGRSVLIAGFSKYGEDKFYNFADAETMEFVLGNMDINRYGRGLMYGLGALTKTRNVIFKRLVPDDACFANLEFKTSNSTETRTDICDPQVLKDTIDADPGLTKPPVEPRELEVKSFAGQSSVYFEYNPENVVVYLDGAELHSGEYIASNGEEIIFTPEIAVDDKLINIYTVITNLDDPSTLQWVKYEYVETTSGNTVINVPGGFDVSNVWITLNGYELNNEDFLIGNCTPIDPNDPTSPCIASEITFQLGGVPGNGLNEDDVVIVHSAIDTTNLGDTFHIHQYTVQEDNTQVLDCPDGYNPDFTIVAVNGIVLGQGDYRADDGVSIAFANALRANDVVRIHTMSPGDFSHDYGALIAKAGGAGYNDLYVQFRPAYDVEKVHSDEEGDVRYKFNFLKAAIYEQTVNGSRKVSDDFIVSLIDVDPMSQMPIISVVTGEALYINDKFKISNEFLEFYMNESFLPEFYKELNINDLTTDALGNPGGNRLIIKNQVADPSGTGVAFKNNVELVVNSVGELEKKSTVIEGKDAIYTYFNDPETGNRTIVKIEVFDGKFLITDQGTTGEVIYPLYLDGVTSFFKGYIRKVDPTTFEGDAIFDRNTQYIIDPKAYTDNHRWKLYNMLIGGEYQNAAWQMQSGTDGQNLILDGRLNLGYVPGDLYHQDAKQLLIDFFNNNEVIHEVLYPELDFDYIPDWTQDIDVINAIVQLADEIGITMPIVSLPRATSPDEDYRTRIEDVYFSSFNTMIYSGQNNDNHYMEKMGTIISSASSYYALLDHLQTDSQISITEPVANIVKGQLPVSKVDLSYVAKSADIERLRFAQVNTIIKEIDGIYFIDQLTAYKSASKLSRANVVKVIHRMRKDLPKILKDLLQRKALENILLAAKTRTEKYMARWLVTDNNTVDGIFSEIQVTPYFIEEELKLVISIAVKPVGTIEKIEVPITVY